MKEKHPKGSLRQRIRDFYYQSPRKQEKPSASAGKAEAPQEEKTGVSADPVLRRMRAVCIALGAGILLAAAGILLIVFNGRQPASQVQKETVASKAYDPTAVVLRYNGGEMTNVEFFYYFWNEYVYLLSNSSTAPFDTSKALSDQMYDENTTWEQYLVSQALDTARQTVALKLAAQEAAFTLPDDYRQTLDQQIDAYAQKASDSGFTDADGKADVDAFLVSLYGKGATEQTFTAYLEDTFLASAYSDQLRAEPTFTEQQLSDYYDEYADEYEQEYGISKDDTRPCSLRCIFLKPETEDEDGWTAVREKAQALYSEWEKDPTEDSFAALADKNNEDTQAQSGGLYPTVMPGQAEEVIDNWCFDAGRKSGDCTVLETSTSCVLIYYVAAGDTPCWKLSAESDLRYETYSSAVTALIEKCGFTADEDVILVETPSGLAAETGAD